MASRRRLASTPAAMAAAVSVASGGTRTLVPTYGFAPSARSVTPRLRSDSPLPYEAAVSK